VEPIDHPHQRGRAVGDRRVDHLAATGAPRFEQGRKHAHDQVGAAAAEVADQVQRYGRTRRRAHRVEGAGDGDVADVVAGRRCPRAVLTPAGHASVNKLRITCQAGLGADAETFGDTGAVAFNEDVGAFDQLEDDLSGALGAQIDNDRLAPARGDVVDRCAAVTHGSRPADPQHLGAHIGEQHRRGWPGPDASQLEHAHAGQRSTTAHETAFLSAPTAQADRYRVKQTTGEGSAAAMNCRLWEEVGLRAWSLRVSRPTVRASASKMLAIVSTHGYRSCHRAEEVSRRACLT
jgi:hypothetical protein